LYDYTLITGTNYTCTYKMAVINILSAGLRWFDSKYIDTSMNAFHMRHIQRHFRVDTKMNFTMFFLYIVQDEQFVSKTSTLTR